MLKIVSDLKSQLEQNIIAHQDILNMSDDIIEIVQIIKKKLKKGGKILFCGNGGSAHIYSHSNHEYVSIRSLFIYF